MEARVARIESDVAHIRSDVAEMKIDIRSLRDKTDAANIRLSDKVDDVRASLDGRIDELKDSLASAKVWALVLYVALAGSLLAAMARGFDWI